MITEIRYPSDIKKIEYPSYSMAPLGSVSWGAIWGGAFVTVATLMCLGLFTASFGMANWTTGGPSVISLGPWNAVWLWFCGIVSYFFGGWVTGHLTHQASAADNGVHSLVTWAVATVGLVLLLVGGTLGQAGPVLSISQTGLFFTPPTHAGLVAFYAFCVLFFEGIASMLGGFLGTRLYRPVAVEESRTNVHREHVGR